MNDFSQSDIKTFEYYEHTRGTVISRSADTMPSSMPRPKAINIRTAKEDNSYYRRLHKVISTSLTQDFPPISSPPTTISQGRDSSKNQTGHKKKLTSLAKK